MAGMLPGVESARRRRFHGHGGSSDSNLASGFGYPRRNYISSHDCNISSSSSMLRSMVNYQKEEDENLGGAAREAKERLNERLRAQWNLDSKKSKKQEKVVGIEKNPTMVFGDLHIEVFGSKSKYGSKRFMKSLGMLGWKSSDQDECAVCLEIFKTGQTLVHLTCAHRFHSNCLAPWLENNAHCPCCRMEVLTT